MSKQLLSRPVPSGVTTLSLTTRLARLATPLLGITAAVLLSATTNTIAYAQTPDNSGNSVPNIPNIPDIGPVLNSLGLLDSSGGAVTVQVDENGNAILGVNGKTIDDPAVLDLIQKSFGNFNWGGEKKGEGIPEVIPKTPVAEKGKITLSPSIIPVDSKSHAATFHLINPSNDSIPLDFVVQDAPPGQSRPTSVTAGKHLSLAGWVQDVPQGVVLAPHETLTVAMHVTVPSDAAPGKYATHVVVYYQAPIKIDASTDLSGDGLSFLSDTTANGFPASRYVLGKLVYTKGQNNQLKQTVSKRRHE